MVKAILIFKSLTGWLLLPGLMLILGSGCASNSPAPTPAVTSAPSLARAQIIVLGDIDAYEPLKKVKRFGPLASYLAENLRR